MRVEEPSFVRGECALSSLYSNLYYVVDVLEVMFADVLSSIRLQEYCSRERIQGVEKGYDLKTELDQTTRLLGLLIIGTKHSLIPPRHLCLTGT